MNMEIDRVFLGDCLNLMPQFITNESVNLVYADPPYNLSGNGLKWEGNKTGGDWYMVDENWDKMSPEEYLNFTHQWISECKRILKANGSIYVSCSFHNIGEIIITLKALQFKINNIITWYKKNSMPNMTKRVFTHSTEFVVWAVKGTSWVFNYETLKKINPEKQLDGTDKQMRDMWSFPLVQGKERLRQENQKALHPTQKPEELLKRIILASSNPGDIVFDPFLGSGTTAVVANMLGRHFIGIESNESYYSAAVKRLESVKMDK